MAKQLAKAVVLNDGQNLKTVLVLHIARGYKLATSAARLTQPWCACIKADSGSEPK